MPSLDITPAWWLLIPVTAGFFLTFRLWKNNSFGISSRLLLIGGVIHMAALILLAMGLFSPALIFKNSVFHDPVIILARDQSASFRSGKSLDLENEYSVFTDTLVKHYTEQGFKVKILDFSGNVKLANPGQGKKDIIQDKDPVQNQYYTNFWGLSHFIRDSLQWKNIQGLFLFSDGNANMPANSQEILRFNLPVYPVVFKASFGDVQLDTAIIRLKERKNDKNAELIVYWTEFSSPKRDITINIPDGKNGTFTERVKNFKNPEPGRFYSKLEIPLPVPGCDTRKKTTNVTLISSGENSNPFNDSLSVHCPVEEQGPEIVFLNNVNSPDERWMIRTLIDEGGYKVTNTSWEKIKNITDCAEMQIWLPASFVKNQESGLKKLSENKCRIAVYGNLNSPVQWPSFWSEFPVALPQNSGINVFKPFEKYFQNLHLNLSDISDDYPWFPGLDSSMFCLISVSGQKSTGCILADAGPFYRLAVSGFWKKAFSPAEPYTVKEQIKSLITGTAQIIFEKNTDIHILLPDKIMEDIPFDISLLTDKIGTYSITFSSDLKNYTFKLNKVKTDGKQEHFSATGVCLPAGHFYITLDSAESRIWSDSLKVKPLKSFELSKLGFSSETLNSIAAGSGGHILTGSLKEENNAVHLPEFSHGQIEEVKYKRMPLYNTRTIFLLLLCLSVSYWYLRKKLSLD